MFQIFNDKLILIFSILGLMFTGFVLSLITGLNSNLLNILGAVGSLLAGLATVATTVIAYQAYNNWRQQITSTSTYKVDVELVTTLKNIHEKCYTFSDFYGSQIFYIFSQYKSLTLTENPDEEYLRSTNAELNGELKDVRKAVKEGMDYSLLIEFNNQVLHKSNHVFKSNINPIQELINYQNALKTYIHAVNIITRRKLTSTTIQDFPYIDGRSDVTFMSIGLDGDLYLNLQHSYDAVLKYYQHEWKL
ncbi:hypothetical protein HWV03_21810 [Moritella sp. 36]|uniref:hypothetical protein n=1 Tax=Moritella sp. 36 TaxID=2746233 RepID=UPI001BA930B1|nr:hypothetical protein [Moritella sp. 36]QUM91211.1 hypothetical protein HWV03_21810 [Moritella sp. 36]